MPFSFASPEDLSQLEATLERAWKMLEARYGHDPLRVAADRERLAYIVAMLWRQGSHEGIAEKAVEHFEATAPLVNPAPTPDDQASA